MQPKREYPSSTIAFSSSRVMPLKASRGVWSMGVEEVGVDGSNNPIEYTGETSRPSAARNKLQLQYAEKSRMSGFAAEAVTERRRRAAATFSKRTMCLCPTHVPE